MPSKVAERLFLDQMVKDLGLSVTDVEPHDPPDFTMMLDGKRVAVEVTQIFQEEGPRGSPKKAREVGTARQLSALKEKYYSLPCAPPIYVRVYVPPKINSPSLRQPSPDEEETLARELWQTALAELRQIPALKDGQTHSFQLHLRYRGTVKVRVTGVPAELATELQWRNDGDQMGWVSSANLELLDAKIATKAQKMDSYRAGVTSVFLLVVADGGFASGMVQHLPEGTGVDAHGFDAIFFQRYLQSTQRIA